MNIEQLKEKAKKEAQFAWMMLQFCEKNGSPETHKAIWRTEWCVWNDVLEALGEERV